MVSFLNAFGKADDTAIPPVVKVESTGSSKKGRKKMEATNQEVQLTAQEKALQDAQAKADAENAKRVTVTGEGDAKVTTENVGTRIRVGQTRGRNPQVITWEAFDTSKPTSLPKTLAEFMELTKTTEEKVILGYVIDGYNDAQYTAASDPIAEYVNPEWDEETVRQFRIVVRNYSANTGESLEDTVKLIKPGIEKGFANRKAQASAAQK